AAEPGPEPPSRSHATGTTPSPAACQSTQETRVGGGTGPWWPLPQPRTARSALSRPRTGEGPARRGGAGPVGPDGSTTGRGTRRVQGPQRNFGSSKQRRPGGAAVRHVFQTVTADRTS